MDNMKVIRDIVQQVVNNRKLSVVVENDTKLLSSGLLSSMDMLEVILFMEKKGLMVFDDISQDTTDSIQQLYAITVDRNTI